MKKVLVVVDVQKDFYHPEGTLYVKGGEVLPERIAKVSPQFDDVVFTVDWHDISHISFKRENNNDGQWPIHCVKYTEGASLPSIFSPYITKTNVIEKGVDNNKEEYGANPNMIMSSHDENPEECEYVFCGIALSHCVKEPAELFIKKFPWASVKIWLDGGVSIDDGTTIREFMKENNIEEWKPQA